MKKIFFILLPLLFCIFLFAQRTNAQNINLIPNPSVESADNNLPQNWQTESWGNNKPTFTYKSGSAQNGSKSLYISMTNFKTGDAKWYFSPIDVKPGQDYVYRDYYKSSVVTTIVAKSFNSQGNESYIWLGTVPRSTAWKVGSFKFKTPTDSQKITIFHLINKNGTLETDNFSLSEAESLVITDNVPNNSFEQNDEISPLGWQKEKWGTNTASFTYLDQGYTGTHSAKVQMTSYTSGDAKWAYNPQNIAAGDYQFVDYYKSNVTTQIVVRVIKSDDSIEYLGLKTADPSTSWKKYADFFTVPQGAKQITVLHLISSVGYLITDDYSVTSHTASGFAQPIISLTFDDGWEDNYTSVLPVLSQYGLKSTQFYATTYIQNQTDQIYKIQAFADAGHEVGSHTITHPHLTLLPLDQITAELADSKSYLESFVGASKINNFASPYGEYNNTVIGEIKKLYSSHRSTDAGYNTKDNFNAYNIRVQNMTNTTTLAQYNEWLNKAKQDKSWLVIVYHRIGDSPTQYETAPSDFNAQMAALNQSGVAVKTIQSALAELISQL